MRMRARVQETHGEGQEDLISFLHHLQTSSLPKSPAQVSCDEGGWREE